MKPQHMAWFGGLALVASSLLLNLQLRPGLAEGLTEGERSVFIREHVWGWRACWMGAGAGAVMLFGVLITLASVMEGSRKYWRSFFRIAAGLGLFSLVVGAWIYGSEFSDWAIADSIESRHDLGKSGPRAAFLFGVMGWGVFGVALGAASFASLKDRRMPHALAWTGMLAAAFAAVFAGASAPMVNNVAMILWSREACLATSGAWGVGMGALYLNVRRNRQ